MASEIHDIIFGFLASVLRTQNNQLPPSYQQSEGVPYFQYNGRVPPVVIAFRCLPKAYESVLRKYDEENERLGFEVRMGDTAGFEAMNSAEAQIVKEVRITAPRRALAGEDLTKDIEFSTKFSRQFNLATNITRVEFAACEYLESPVDAIRLITEFPYWLAGFKSLKHLSVEISSPGSMFDKKAENKFLKRFIKDIARKVGAQGRRSSWVADKDFGFVVGFDAPSDEEEIYRQEYLADESSVWYIKGKVREWTWTAPKGQTM